MTMDVIHRQPSPTPSVTSFRSSRGSFPSFVAPRRHAHGAMLLATIVHSEIFRQVSGRAFSAKNEMYMLPVDDEEQERQDIEHKIHFLTLDSLYAAPDLVMQALAPRQGRTPAILDLGTGSGIWAIDMAREFPHADVVGVDLVPPKTRLDISVPPNARFEVDDANLDLSHYTECFNVVHMRNMGQGVKDFRQTIHRVAQMLRKNGVLLLASGSYSFYDEHRQPLPVVDEGEPGWSACQTLLRAVYNLGKKYGGDVDSAQHWEEWLNANPLYANVGKEDIFIPVGPWLPNLDTRCTRIAELLQIDIQQAFSSFRPLLIQGGVDPSLVDRWIAAADREMRETRPPMFARWRYVWATRTKTKWYDPPS